LVGKFKLAVSLSSTNMTLFDVDGKILEYRTTVDILQSFFSHRLEFYVKRKDMLLDKMRKELKVLKNKSRFIEEVCEGGLVVSNRKRAELLSELSERGYDLCSKDDKMKHGGDDDEEDETMEESSSDSELAKGYEYLLTLTFERAEDIRRQKADKEAEVAALEATTPESIWLSDLDERVVHLDRLGVKSLLLQHFLHCNFATFIWASPKELSTRRLFIMYVPNAESFIVLCVLDLNQILELMKLLLRIEGPSCPSPWTIHEMLQSFAH
jgi:DNA topoisomerase-2